MTQRCINCEDYEKLIDFILVKCEVVSDALRDVPLRRDIVDKARITADNIVEYIKAIRGV